MRTAKIEIAMPPLVKICGLRTPEHVDAAIKHGATHIGLVHYEPSPRHVDLKTAAELRTRAGPNVKVALLLVNASQQLTGDRSARRSVRQEWISTCKSWG